MGSVDETSNDMLLIAETAYAQAALRLTQSELSRIEAAGTCPVSAHKPGSDSAVEEIGDSRKQRLAAAVHYWESMLIELRKRN